MSSENLTPFKPLFSVVILVLSLFTVVFFQMEERRLGYSLLKLSREHRHITDQKRQLEIQLAKITQPKMVNEVAHRRGDLKKLQDHQIIHLSGSLDIDLKSKDL